jgi:hypothetical protein
MSQLKAAQLNRDLKKSVKNYQNATLLTERNYEWKKESQVIEAR